ncbi:hypothetical protein DRJ12_03745, partial [Candidatus Acetothermia bacterium]
GVENVAMGLVAGHTGHVVVRDLRDRGVTTNFIWTRGETRTNVTILEKGWEYIPVFIDEAGSPVSASEIDRFLRRYRQMLKRASWVVLGGSLRPGIDPSLCRDLVEMASQAGAKVILSTGGDALAEGIKGAPYLVKPDTRDQRKLMGIQLTTRDAIIEAGRKIVAAGAKVVVISHEVTGDIAVTSEGTIWEIKAEVPSTRLKNLIGADDVFLAGILYKLSEGKPLEEALRFGLAAGLLSAESEDKIVGELEDIEREAEKVTVERI